MSVTPTRVQELGQLRCCPDQDQSGEWPPAGGREGGREHLQRGNPADAQLCQVDDHVSGVEEQLGQGPGDDVCAVHAELAAHGHQGLVGVPVHGDDERRSHITATRPVRYRR